MPQYYSFGLLLLFYGLVMMEFFVPSGGLLGVGAALCGISCIVVAFTHSYALGLTFLAIIVFTTPVLFAGLVRIWPRTRLGQQMLNRRVGELASPGQGRITASGVPYADLVGRTGTAATPLLPSGRVLVGDDKLDVISISGPVGRGQSVRIVDVTGGHVRVRQVEQDEETGTTPASTPPPGATQPDVTQPPSFELGELE